MGDFSAEPKASSTASRLSLPAVNDTGSRSFGARARRVTQQRDCGRAANSRAHRKAIMCKLEVDSVARLVRKVYGCD